MLQGTTTFLSLSPLSLFFSPRFHVLINATSLEKSFLQKSLRHASQCVHMYVVVVVTVVMVVGRDEGSKARKARRKKEGGKVESGGGYGHTELRIVDAFNEVSTRRNGWKRLRGART